LYSRPSTGKCDGARATRENPVEGTRVDVFGAAIVIEDSNAGVDPPLSVLPPAPNRYRCGDSNQHTVAGSEAIMLPSASLIRIVGSFVGTGAQAPNSPAISMGVGGKIFREPPPSAVFLRWKQRRDEGTVQQLCRGYARRRSSQGIARQRMSLRKLPRN